ncbi:conserved hypothetical protein [delta proteobacterium NaphS2]|nr:conserved hypothetical protein [delta proteobacterium NaphS2]
MEGPERGPILGQAARPQEKACRLMGTLAGGIISLMVFSKMSDPISTRNQQME